MYLYLSIRSFFLNVTWIAKILLLLYAKCNNNNFSLCRDGVPYCEQDYQTEFGVSCAGCGGYITGKVLQVRDL